MNMIAELGGHFEEMRMTAHSEYVKQSQTLVRDNDKAGLAAVKLKCNILRADKVFFAEGNVLQT